MIQVEETLLWEVTVNGTNIGRCPIDEAFGLTTAEQFVKDAVKSKKIKKSDTDFPHVTTYKVVKESEPVAVATTKAPRKARKTTVKKVTKKPVKRTVKDKKAKPKKERPTR